MKKMPHKLKLIGGIISILKKERRPVTHDEVQKYIIGQYRLRNPLYAKLEKLRPSDISTYFRDYYVKTEENQTSTDHL